jgi:hypothetical protein
MVVAEHEKHMAGLVNSARGFIIGRSSKLQEPSLPLISKGVILNQAVPE